MMNTKQKILDAATTLFIQNGYAATSIGDIAKLAGVNPSLIYHYANDKTSLWNDVKSNLLSSVTTHTIDASNLESFLKTIIQERIHLYKRIQGLSRLIQWQHLETEEKKLSSQHPLSIEPWVTGIKSFQKQGTVRSDYPADLIALMINSLINGCIYDFFDYTKSDNKIDLYVNMTFHCLFHFLSYKAP